MTDKKHLKLILTKKEGHVRMRLFSSPDPHDYEAAQSAGTEMEDALARATTLWSLVSLDRIKKTKDYEIWEAKTED